MVTLPYLISHHHYSSIPVVSQSTPAIGCYYCFFRLSRFVSPFVFYQFNLFFFKPVVIWFVRNLHEMSVSQTHNLDSILIYTVFFVWFYNSISVDVLNIVGNHKLWLSRIDVDVTCLAGLSSNPSYALWAASVPYGLARPPVSRIFCIFFHINIYTIQVHVHILCTYMVFKLLRIIIAYFSTFSLLNIMQ